MGNACRIKVLSPKKKIIEAAEGSNLADVLTSAEIPLNNYCGGKGICGKCLVEIIKGKTIISENKKNASSIEKRFQERFDLACLHTVSKNLTINVPEAGMLPRRSILDCGAKEYFSIKSRIKKCALKIPAVHLASAGYLVDALEKRLRRRLRISLKTLRAFSLKASGSGQLPITITLLDDKEALDIESGDTSKKIFGIAADIGTSTVVLEIVNLLSGESLGRSSALNVQSRFGADVISRIAYAGRDPAHLKQLSDMIHDQFNDLILELAYRHGISPLQIYDICVAGNTVMNHIFMGVSASSLGVSPFHGIFRNSPEAKACELGLHVHPEARVYAAPNIHGFIGGDIAAGLTALDFAEKPGRLLFIDLGTNGEIVLKTGHRITAASTAAGPAFEGMSISCGMPAVDGAVKKVSWKNGFVVSVIGAESPARGVCGTGLIDILAISLKKGLITADGRIKAPPRIIRVTRRLVLTQQDIRRMQLAVAAVKSGILTVLEKEEIRTSDLDQVFVAGAFGSSLNIDNAMAVGLLPLISRRKIRFVGNSSLAGARKLLLSAPDRKKIESSIRAVRHLSLAADRAFQDRFLSALKFQAYSGETA